MDEAHNEARKTGFARLLAVFTETFGLKKRTNQPPQFSISLQQ